MEDLLTTGISVSFAVSNETDAQEKMKILMDARFKYLAQGFHIEFESRSAVYDPSYQGMIIEHYIRFARMPHDK